MSNRNNDRGFTPLQDEGDARPQAQHIAEVVIDSTVARKLRLAEFNPWHPPSTEVAEGQPAASIIIPGPAMAVNCMRLPPRPPG
jgi:hypothetical protein